MYRMPEKQTGSRMVLNCWTVKLFFISMQITYSFAYFPSNWNILTFLTTFWFQKEKNFEEMLCLQQGWLVSMSTFSRFCWRQSCCLWFPRSACLFGHPICFGYQGFISLASDFLFQCFYAGKLREMLQLI